MDSLSKKDGDPSAQTGLDTQSKEGDSAAPSEPSAPQGTSKGYDSAEQDYDTGLQAWLQVLGAFFLWFNSWGIINTWGGFQTFYEQDILANNSPSTIAWIGSLESFFLLFSGLIVGPLFDAGYFYAIVPFGTFMIVFGYMMTSLATEYYQVLLAQGICVGVGTGCLFVASVTLMPQYFRKRLGLVNGIAATGSSIGGVIYPIMFHKLQGQVGFPWATRALGFVALATCSISIAVMRLRFQPKQRRAMFELSAFKDFEYSVVLLAMFIGFMGYYNFLSYIQAWALQKRIVGTSLGFYLLAILNAASTSGRVAPNFLSDHWGPINVFIPCAAITSLLGFCWIAVDSTAGVIVLVILFGFCSGGFVSLPAVVVATITKDMRSFGTRLGMFLAIGSLGLLIGTPIGGAILSDTGGYLGVQSFCGACMLACAMLVLVVRFRLSGRKVIYRT